MNLMASLPEIAYDDADDEEALAAANGDDGDGSVTLQVGPLGMTKHIDTWGGGDRFVLVHRPDSAGSHICNSPHTLRPGLPQDHPRDALGLASGPAAGWRRRRRRRGQQAPPSGPGPHGRQLAQQTRAKVTQDGRGWVRGGREVPRDTQSDMQ